MQINRTTIESLIIFSYQLGHFDLVEELLGLMPLFLNGEEYEISKKPQGCLGAVLGDGPDYTELRPPGALKEVPH